jgi:hypothetical protein
MMPSTIPCVEFEQAEAEPGHDKFDIMHCRMVIKIETVIFF